MPTQDITIWDEAGNYSVDVTPDGKLKVDAQVTASQTDPLYEAGFTESTSNGIIYIIPNPGKYNAQADVITDIMENQPINDTDTVTQLTTTTGAMQIFRASADNIARLQLITSINTDPVMIEDFEGPNVESEWLSSNNNKLWLGQDNLEKHDGTYSLYVHTRGTADGQWFYKQYITPLDLSNVDNINFWVKSLNTNQRWRMYVSDGTNWKQSGIFSNSSVDVWEYKELDYLQFTEQGPGTTDDTNIIEIGFIADNATNTDSWFDTIQYKPLPNSQTIHVKLYDFGSNPNPTSLNDGTLLTTDDGQTVVSATIQKATKSWTIVPYTRGVFNPANALTPGNYYGIVVDDDGVNIYGSASKLYNNGDAYAVDINTGNLTALNKTSSFMTWYVPDQAYIVGLVASADAPPKNTVFNLGVESVSANTIKHSIMTNTKLYALTDINVRFGRPLLIEKGDRLHAGIEHDGMSDFTELCVTYQYLIKPITRYG